MYTQLEKTILLLRSNDDDQIINAIQLLDTMYDLFPSEVEQVWSLLNKEEIYHIWSVYFTRLFPILEVEYQRDGSLRTWFTMTWTDDMRDEFGEESLPSTWCCNISIDVIGRRKYRGHRLAVSFTSYWDPERLKVATATYIYGKRLGPEDVELASVDHGSPKEQSLLGVDMSNASLNSFHYVLTILNSPFLKQAINEYLEIINNEIQ